VLGGYNSIINIGPDKTGGSAHFGSTEVCHVWWSGKVGLIPVGEEFGNFYSYPFLRVWRFLWRVTPGNLAGFSHFIYPLSHGLRTLKIT